MRSCRLPPRCASSSRPSEDSSATAALLRPKRTKTPKAALHRLKVPVQDGEKTDLRVDAELSVDRRQMVADRALREVQGAGDLRAAATGAQLPEDLHLASGQRLEARHLAGGGEARYLGKGARRLNLEGDASQPFLKLLGEISGARHVGDRCDQEREAGGVGECRQTGSTPTPRAVGSLQPHADDH